MVLYIYLKTGSERSVEAARAACGSLSRAGVKCVSESGCAALLGGDVREAEPASGDYDMIAAVGGDGTMLSAAQLAIAAGRPVFGINSGRVGFLCAFDAEQASSITPGDIESLRVSDRALLEARCGCDDTVRYALNEVTVSKINFSKTVEFSIYYGESCLGDMRADGLIVSTPTGSTGYSLSAGGPIVEPGLRAVVVTPICAHSIFSRSHVLTGGKPVRIVPAMRFANQVSVSVDGGEYAELEPSGEISVLLSERTLSLLTNDKRDFFELLHNEISGRR